MKNIKTILIVIVVLVLVGGGYYGYTSYQEQEQARIAAEAKAQAEKDAQAAQKAQELAIANRTKCVATDKYSIVTLDHDNAVGQDILVLAKTDSQECKYDNTNAVFEIKNSDPEYYKYQIANALVTDLGTGPSGRSIRLYDLGDKKMITEKKYFGDLSLTGNTLTYFGEAKQKADAKNCKDFKTLTKDGLGAVLTVEKNVDLKTFLVKEGKTTKCVAVQ